MGCASSEEPSAVEGGDIGAVVNDDAASDLTDVGREEPTPEPEPALTAWPEVVQEFPFLDDQTLSADLADGAAVEMGWADEPTVACWTILHQSKFEGNQVYFALDRALQKSSQLTITVVPTARLDVNIYAVAQPIDTYYFPPDVPSASSCVSGFGEGEGGQESVTLQNLNQPLMWLIAVSGPAGVESGAFELRIERSDLQSGF